jgi:hypothetical protein
MVQKYHFFKTFMMNTLPNFLIVGASKSGTSSLYHYLKQHPEIYLSEKQKEGRYFSQMKDIFNGPGDKNIENTVTQDLDSYTTLFEGYKNELAIGDISPEYLYFYENAIPLIKKNLGEKVKIIIILRNPVDRAFSGYTHFKRDQRENLNFEEALLKENERKEKKWIWAWQYKNSGFYFEQVKAFLGNFENVRVIIYEDFKTNEQKVLNEICKFLGVQAGFQFDTSYKYNVSGDPKNAVLYKLETSRELVNFIKKFIPRKLVSEMKKRWTGEKQMIKLEMDPKTRLELIDFFREDILKLQKLLNRDLSHWLK